MSEIKKKKGLKEKQRSFSASTSKILSMQGMYY